MDTYFEPSDSLENKTIEESLDPNHLLEDMTSIEDNPFISNGISVGIDTNLGGIINSFNLGLNKEPSLKGKFEWKKLALLAVCVLLVITFIGAGIAISLSSQNQGMEPTKILGPRCLTTNDSPDKNAECKFPWKFEGKVINECTDASTPDGK